MATATEERKKRSPIVRILMSVTALFTAWHIFASFLWIAPYSPIREVVPGDMLRNYMIPMFGQSWSVFAPEPINGDYRFEVRAIIEDGGEFVETEWVDATEVELSMIQYNLFPPRAGIGASEVASQSKGAFDKLTADHKVIAALNYFEEDWAERLEDKMKEYGETGLVDAYVKAEQQALAYASQVAFAMWGEEQVVRVQYQSSRQNVIPFAKRNDPDAERPARQLIDVGWRGTVVREGQSQHNFEKTFTKFYDRLHGGE